MDGIPSESHKLFLLTYHDQVPVKISVFWNGYNKIRKNINKTKTMTLDPRNSTPTTTTNKET